MNNIKNNHTADEKFDHISSIMTVFLNCLGFKNICIRKGEARGGELRIVVSAEVHDVYISQGLDTTLPKEDLLTAFAKKFARSYAETSYRQ